MYPLAVDIFSNDLGNVIGIVELEWIEKFPKVIWGFTNKESLPNLNYSVNIFF